jgi:hypothetical protein
MDPKIYLESEDGRAALFVSGVLYELTQGGVISFPRVIKPQAISLFDQLLASGYSMPVQKIIACLGKLEVFNDPDDAVTAAMSWYARHHMEKAMASFPLLVPSE